LRKILNLFRLPRGFQEALFRTGRNDLFCFSPTCYDVAAILEQNIKRERIRLKRSDKAATVPEAKKVRCEPRVIEEAIRRFLNENHECKNYKPIRDYLQRQGIKLTQPSISRYLKRLKATKDPATGFWSLEKITAYERNLLELEKLFETTRDTLPSFSKNVKIAVLKTKPHFNSLIAKQIRETFVDEVVGAFCPNDAVIVVLYCPKGNKSDDSDNNDPFEKILSGLCEKFTLKE
jgi:arginine repressor